MLIAGVPLWMTEVSPVRNRGALVNVHAALYLTGFMAAGWVGYGFYSATNATKAAWRGPIGKVYVLRHLVSNSFQIRHRQTLLTSSQVYNAYPLLYFFWLSTGSLRALDGFFSTTAATRPTRFSCDSTIPKKPLPSSLKLTPKCKSKKSCQQAF